MLRRGPNQKILSYSLSRNNDLSTNADLVSFKDVVQNAKRFFPDWTVRLYVGPDTKQATRCAFQCMRDERHDLLHNLDVCDVSTLPFDAHTNWNLSYMPALHWRMLPIADDFVDIMVNRNERYCAIEREIGAVNEWIRSKSLFHVMRGNYTVPVLYLTNH